MPYSTKMDLLYHLFDYRLHLILRAAKGDMILIMFVFFLMLCYIIDHTFWWHFS